ncbi:ABC transporter permease [Mycoplasmatota bacterium]|nr:ABC transporter permease [Mycoplasmatota bacterium]
MLKFTIRRFLSVIITLLVISFLTFVLMHLAPGNPFLSEKGLDPDVLEALNKRYGLDDHLIVQYFNYLKGLVQWDFGVSFKLKGMTVERMIKDGFKPTALVGFYGCILIVLLGIPLGIISALKHNKFIDRFSMFISVIGVTIPGFVFATLYLYVFSAKLGWAPPFGVGTFKHYIGPALCISFFSLAFVTRLTRTSMLEVLQQDYIRTARAKGLSNFKVLYKHALRNAVIPVVTYIGPMIAAILTGSFVIEKVFAIPGIGSYYTESVSNRDYTLIMGMTMFYAVFLVIAVFIVDILYAVIDPRIKYEK